MTTLFWFIAYIHLSSQEPRFLEEVEKYTTPMSSRKVLDTDFHKLLSSPFLNSALKETLRIQLHNVFPRYLIEDTLIKISGKEYILKKGSRASAPSTLLNYNPKIYPEPLKWKPDRFLANDAQGTDYLEKDEGPKIDVKKLKFPLVIWGGGSHMVLTLER